MHSNDIHGAVSVASGFNLGHQVHARVFRGAVMAILGLALSFGVVANAGAANLACKPSFEITNGKDTAVKVLALYYTDGNGSDYKEGLDNKKLSGGEKETWKSVKLQHMAEGNPIGSIRVEYRNDTSGQGAPSSPWGEAVKTVWFKQDGTDCTDGKTYEITIP